ncbi:hypothetical protein LBW89_09730 [Paenibacillus sp. alder61]|uniref:hypothetical protein n=1 Tax=Paenibacillus TaxID=44249 RepID=UPI001B87BFE9|nr:MULTISPECIES: hypothetical protein [Paenibacillus]MCA1293298.1 hypothetical protein [Paenibacillus sp. alder61]
MRAMVQISYGPPEVIVLQEITKPSLGSKELLVHIQAAKVGPSDCAFRKGNLFIKVIISHIIIVFRKSPQTNYCPIR